MPFLEFPFVQGLTEENDPRISPPGTLVRCENLRASRNGRLVRRRGFVSIDANDRFLGTLSNGLRPFRLFCHNGAADCWIGLRQDGLVDVTKRYGSNEVEQINDASTVGYPISRIANRRLANAPGSKAWNCSVASDSETIVTVWEYQLVSGGNYWIGWDYATLDGTSVASGSIEVGTSRPQPRVIWVSGAGTTGYVLGYFNSGTGNLVAASFDFVTSAFAWTARQTLDSGFGSVNSRRCWDWCYRDGTTLVVALSTVSAGLSALVHKTIDVSGTMAAPVTVNTYSTVLIGGVSVYANASNTFIAFHDETNSDLVIRINGTTNYTLDSAWTSDSQRHRFSIGPGTSTSQATIVWGDGTTLASGSGVKVGTMTSAGVFSTPREIAWGHVASKPFVRNGVYCCFVATLERFSGAATTSTGDARCLMLLSGSAPTSMDRLSGQCLFRVAGWNYIGDSSGSGSDNIHCPDAPAVIDSNRYAHGWTEIDGGPLIGRMSDAADSSSPAVLTWAWDSLKTLQSVALGGVTHFAASVPLAYDGQGLVETAHAWTAWTSSNGSGGGGMEAGSRFWVARVVWTDAAGNKYASNVGNQWPYTLASNEYLDLEFAVNPVGSTAGSSAAIEVYRTTAGGSIFYLLTTIPLVAQTNYYTFRDNITDVTIRSKATLAAGGELLAAQCPQLDCVTAHKGRLFGSGGDTLHYSHKLEPGEGATWPEVFQLRAPADITGLASLDEALLVFTASRVYALFGDGPNRLGDQSYAVFTDLPCEVGCTDWRSIVVYRDGCAFRSARGLELIPRGLGAPVPLFPSVYDNQSAVSQGVIADNPYTLAALDRPEHTQIRWLVGTSETSGGKWVCYDYSHKLWTTETGFTAGNQAALWSSNMLALGLWNGTSGFVSTQTESENAPRTNYMGDGDSSARTVANAVIETGDLRAPGLTGWHRVRKIRTLGTYTENGNLQIDVTADRGRSAGSHTFTAFGSGGDDFVAQYAPSIQKCASVRVKLTLVDDESQGEGLALHGLSIEYEPMPRGARVRATHRG